MLPLGRSSMRHATTCSSFLFPKSLSRRNYHIAVVGSGPAGFYTSKYLFKKAAGESLKVDMFERLPTPFGLVRFGVAPDHPEVKNVINDFSEVAETPGFRFFGNIEISPNKLSLSSLRKHYDAVVLCTGAEGEKHLGIPGENLAGVVGAPGFVKWYNGHPDFTQLQVPPPGEAAVVLGQGNVALDAARLLVRSPEEVHGTDMEAQAIERIASWQKAGLRTVHVVGRRGFVQAAFTNAELRELLTISEHVLPIVDPAELTLCRNPASEEELAKSRMKKRTLEILEKMANNFAQRESTSKRLLWLRFLRAPTEIIPGEPGQVGSIRLQRTELRGEPGKQTAAPASTSDDIDLACGLIVRSVGFDLLPLEGLPLNERNRVPHTNGCVDPGTDETAGLYVSGWVKRGPQGIIASNIADAQETATKILADLAGRTPKTLSADEMSREVSAMGCPVVTFEDWKKLQMEEQRCGKSMGKTACKFTDVSQMIKHLDKAA
eukprot:TRINITY_DN89520_c0_g1_i1.p1 TRINITY_DN89520_c0_g1~~TRINITY_DN89520_c0_g1_i1.p1  ORF type:complete len:502 (-),score=80.98 TRINITY_DN89520_c0_g1_i1:373-1845(-)